MDYNIYLEKEYAMQTITEETKKKGLFVKSWGGPKNGSSEE